MAEAAAAPSERGRGGFGGFLIVIYVIFFYVFS